jgi:four helix bundle protein
MHRHLFPFEKLEVWQESRRLVTTVYALTRSFPAEERFGLKNQLSRAAVSVASNLAEGRGRASLRDQGHFSQLAYSSLMEVACQISLASDIGFTSVEHTEKLHQDIGRLGNKINALRNSQLARSKKELIQAIQRFNRSSTTQQEPHRG